MIIDPLSHVVLWRRLDLPGHESCRVSPIRRGWELSGSAVFTHEDQPCRLDYAVDCGPDWKTRSTRITGWAGHRRIALEANRDATGLWYLNGSEAPDVEGCLDVDLGFSPSTNLMPIRRLSLEVGESAEVQAAWLPFPKLEFQLLPQRYTRLSESTYRYESAGGRFVRDLTVDEHGLVISYPGIWERESST